MSSAAAKGFVKFEERVATAGATRGIPEVWIGTKGRVRFNNSAAKSLNPKAPGKAFRVDLYWNGETRVIGIAPCADGLHPVSSTTFNCAALKVLMSRWGGAGWEKKGSWKLIGTDEAPPIKMAFRLPKAGGE